jgi:hypothetical protein
MRPSVPVAGHRLKTARGLEFHSGTQGIADGEAQQRAATTRLHE